MIALLISSLGLAGIAFGSIASDTDVLEMFKAVGMERVTEGYITQTLKPRMEKLTAAEGRNLEALVTSEMPNVMKLMAPAFKNAFSQDEIRDITKFFSSPSGKKFNEMQVRISQDAFAAISPWLVGFQARLDQGAKPPEPPKPLSGEETALSQLSALPKEKKAAALSAYNLATEFLKKSLYREALHELGKVHALVASGYKDSKDLESQATRALNGQSNH